MSLLRSLFDDHRELVLREDPLLATQVGDRRHNARLGDPSVEGRERRAAGLWGLLRRAEAVDRGGLSEGDLLDHELFLRQMREEIESHGHRGWVMPLNKTGGFHTFFPEMHRHLPLDVILLDGALPLDALERKVERWLRSSGPVQK